MAACVTPRAPPTATTVFIYDAYTLRRNVVRALGHAAARKYDRYFAIAENPILINALLRKNAALDPDYATARCNEASRCSEPSDSVHISLTSPFDFFGKSRLRCQF